MANKPPPLTAFSAVLLLVLVLCVTAHGGFITAVVQPSELVSDGVHGGYDAPPLLLRLRGSESCEETYGFLPCTTTVLGNLFLILGYGYLMFLAATYLSNGSELLLQILGPGIVGGLFLPVLGALPDAMLILVDGAKRI
ncbi:sodium/calcium exchanger family protein / calcium-binding EF hand family protein [Actinidia rufa]|uniref:Sodium/calcium exchanger family protein / calcium-binding EF hand family protein n=1 Tax=Actinidia rufa TaxID=165716 RepID=A0A7J0G3V0_9ERIC|nr:sodium/calcium exchanger family protein / calcium-binding EF hand family protein [Actinidia rufa]